MSRRRIWDIAVFSGLVLIGAVVAYRWQLPDPEPAATGLPTSRNVDLLSMLDVGRDRVRGDWSKDGPNLLTAEEPFGRLQIPYAPPEEYFVLVEVMRRSGTDSFNFGLNAGGRQFVVVLDGMKDGDTAGVDILDGKGFMENPTTFRGKLLPQDQKRIISYTVTRDRLVVSVDNRTVIDWTGDFHKASTYHEWSVPRPEALFVGSYSSRFQINQILLTSLRGEGRILR